jgi:hypothetical protein
MHRRFKFLFKKTTKGFEIWHVVDWIRIIIGIFKDGNGVSLKN